MTDNTKQLRQIEETLKQSVSISKRTGNDISSLNRSLQTFIKNQKTISDREALNAKEARIERKPSGTSSNKSYSASGSSGGSRVKTTAKLGLGAFVVPYALDAAGKAYQGTVGLLERIHQNTYQRSLKRDLGAYGQGKLDSKSIAKHKEKVDQERIDGYKFRTPRVTHVPGNAFNPKGYDRERYPDRPMYMQNPNPVSPMDYGPQLQKQSFQINNGFSGAGYSITLAGLSGKTADQLESYRDRIASTGKTLRFTRRSIMKQFSEKYDTLNRLIELENDPTIKANIEAELSQLASDEKRFILGKYSDVDMQTIAKSMAKDNVSLSDRLRSASESLKKHGLKISSRVNGKARNLANRAIMETDPVKRNALFDEANALLASDNDRIHGRISPKTMGSVDPLLEDANPIKNVRTSVPVQNSTHLTNAVPEGNAPVSSVKTQKRFNTSKPLSVFPEKPLILTDSQRIKPKRAPKRSAAHYRKNLGNAKTESSAISRFTTKFLSNPITRTIIKGIAILGTVGDAYMVSSFGWDKLSNTLMMGNGEFHPDELFFKYENEAFAAAYRFDYKRAAELGGKAVFYWDQIPEKYRDGLFEKGFKLDTSLYTDPSVWEYMVTNDKSFFLPSRDNRKEFEFKQYGKSNSDGSISRPNPNPVKMSHNPYIIPPKAQNYGSSPRMMRSNSNTGKLQTLDALNSNLEQSNSTIVIAPQNNMSTSTNSNSLNMNANPVPSTMDIAR